MQGKLDSGTVVVIRGNDDELRLGIILPERILASRISFSYSSAPGLIFIEVFGEVTTHLRVRGFSTIVLDASKLAGVIWKPENGIKKLIGILSALAGMSDDPIPKILKKFDKNYLYQGINGFGSALEYLLTLASFYVRFYVGEKPGLPEFNTVRGFPTLLWASIRPSKRVLKM